MESLNNSSQSKKHYLSTLSVILKEAVRDQYLKSNPCDLVEVERVRNKRNNSPTWDEIKALFPEDIKQMKSIWGKRKLHYGVMCQLITATGLRVSEARALTPRAFDFNRSGIMVVKTVNAAEELDLPKAGEIRVILMDSKTSSFINWWITWGGFNQDDLIFPGRTGKAIHRGTILKSYKEALVKANIIPDGRKLTVHGLP
jgi:integrase